MQDLHTAHRQQAFRHCSSSLSTKIFRSCLRCGRCGITLPFAGHRHVLDVVGSCACLTLSADVGCHDSERGRLLSLCDCCSHTAPGSEHKDCPGQAHINQLHPRCEFRVHSDDSPGNCHLACLWWNALLGEHFFDARSNPQYVGTPGVYALPSLPRLCLFSMSACLPVRNGHR